MYYSNGLNQAQDRTGSFEKIFDTRYFPIHLLCLTEMVYNFDPILKRIGYSSIGKFSCSFLGIPTVGKFHGRELDYWVDEGSVTMYVRLFFCCFFCLFFFVLFFFCYCLFFCFVLVFIVDPRR